MKEGDSSPELRAVHGLLIVGLMMVVGSAPSLRRWPWFWAAILAGYFLAVACVPALRRTFIAWKFGTGSRLTILATIVVAAGSSLALIVFQIFAHPDVGQIRSQLPAVSGASLILTAFGFAIVNATLEELIFRGILFDAAEPMFGRWPAILATSVFFGWGHMHGGYPPGLLGAFLASIFGVATAVLRCQTRGLGYSIVAHICADVTIFVLVASAR